MQLESVVICDQIYSYTQMPETSRTPDSVQISFSHFGKVEVYDDIDCLDVDSTREEITANKITAQTIAEVVENSVAVRLRHSGVNVITTIAQFRDLFSQ
jgi:hypothetical protein